MLKKTVTYEDFDGVERTEDFYFHFSEAELLEMELGTTGSLTSVLTKIIESKDQKRIMEHFKDIVLKAYGEKSDDGRRFIKSKELAEAFSHTPAYSIIFMELASNDDAATNFVNGCMPKNLLDNVKQHPAVGIGN